MPDFRFRLPSINDLTNLQQVAFYEARPVLVTGGPGSGKTVVSVFRYLRQITTDQKAMFFTFNRTLMSAIRGTLRQQADIRLPGLTEVEVERILQTKIASMFEWYGVEFHRALSLESDEEIKDNFITYRQNRLGQNKFTEIVFDESQDLRPGVLTSAYELATKVSCGADRAQDLQGHYAGPADDIIYGILQSQNRTVRQGLTSNFRNTREIFEFARRFVLEDLSVQDIQVDELPGGESPEIIELNEQEQLATLIEIIRQNPNNNIGILVHFKSQIIKVKEHLEQNGFSCGRHAANNVSFSYYYNGMPDDERNGVEQKLRTPFILSYDSCKGLEFDIVVMPFFEKADWALNNYKPSNENPEHDANGHPKTWATKNHYYVACTRARSLLYVMYSRKPRVLDFLNPNRKRNDFFRTNPLDDLPF